MDDDDLTQDILDQFDLICTQHQLDDSHMAPRVTNRNPHDHFMVQTKTTLERTKSLDASITVATVSPRTVHGVTKGDGLDSGFIERKEYENIQKEVATLREALYMKLGELATIKESANRVNATKSDAIARLEHSLNTEREEFQRRLNELNTQIAFREADYRLVTSELARLKEQLTATKIPLQDRTMEFSPSSQLLISAAASPYVDRPTHLSSHQRQRSPTHHLPVSISPVPSKRRSRHLDGTWNVPMAIKAIPFSFNPGVPNGHQTTGHDAPPSGKLFEENSSMHETPRKRMRSASDYSGVSSPDDPSTRQPTSHDFKQYVDAGVETDEVLSNHLAGYHRKLRYRISKINTNSCNNHRSHQSPIFSLHPTPFDLASDLIRLGLSDVCTTTSTRENVFNPLRTDSVRPRSTLQIGSTALSESSPSTWNSAYKHLLGVNVLIEADNEWLSSTRHETEPNADLSTVLRYARTLAKNWDNLTPRIEEIFKLVPTLLDSSACHRLISDSSLPVCYDSDIAPTASVSSPVGEREEEVISCLSEDPFAGAPASQVVAPLPRTMSQRVHRNPRLPSDVTSSAPATVYFSTADSMSTVPYLSTTSELHLSPRDFSIIQQGLLCLKQLQCITLTLQRWHLSASFLVHGMTRDGEASDSVDTGGDIFTISYHRISTLLKDFIGELAKQHIIRWISHKSASTTYLQQCTHSFEPPSSTPATHSIRISATNQLNQLSQMGVKQIMLLQIFSACVLEQAALVASSVHRTEPLHSVNNDPLIWRLSLVDCLILTSTGFKLPTTPHFGEDSDSSTNSVVVFPQVYPPAILALIRLLRHMVSSTHWNVGHETSNWWETHLTNSDGGSDNDNRLECLRSLLGTKMSCRLLAIISWIRCAADQFPHTSATLPEFTSPSSDAFSLHRCEEQSVHLIDLLDEFSAFIASLVIRDDVVWPDSCGCKAEVYSTLIHLAGIPLQTLLTLPVTLDLERDKQSANETRHLRYIESRCISAFGQLTRTLTALLWRHGDACFQTHTDRLPAYFFLISSLSSWMRQSRFLSHSNIKRTPSAASGFRETILRPELVEELHDFDTIVENNTKTT